MREFCSLHFWMSIPVEILSTSRERLLIGERDERNIQYGVRDVRKFEFSQLISKTRPSLRSSMGLFSYLQLCTLFRSICVLQYCTDLLIVTGLAGTCTFIKCCSLEFYFSVLPFFIGSHFRIHDPQSVQNR